MIDMPMDDALRRIMAQRMAQGGGGGQAPVVTGDMRQGGGMPMQGGGMPAPSGDGRPGVPTAAVGSGGGIDPRAAMMMAALARSRGETPAVASGAPTAATQAPTARKAAPKARGKTVPKGKAKGKVPAKGKAVPKGKAPAAKAKARKIPRG